MGKSDGKLAKPGKKVVVKYKGSLASNGKVFDETKGNKTFSFRLGKTVDVPLPVPDMPITAGSSEYWVEGRVCCSALQLSIVAVCLLLGTDNKHAHSSMAHDAVRPCLTTCQHWCSLRHLSHCCNLLPLVDAWDCCLVLYRVCIVVGFCRCW